MIEIRKYIKEDGSCPFDLWINKIRDQRAKARILIRLNRLELGLFGDCKPIAEGVHELRIPEGKGYRVYFGQEGDKLILLLCGGSKATQPKDIKQALTYWKAFKEVSHDKPGISH